MRVVAYEVNGLAKNVLKVREVPDPQPGPGEVRVRIHFSSVNPTDVKRRFSESPQFGAFQVPHQDGSGLLIALAKEYRLIALAKRFGCTTVPTGESWEQRLSTSALLRNKRSLFPLKYRSKWAPSSVFQ